MLFGLWNLIASLLDPVAEDTPVALLTFYGSNVRRVGSRGFVATRRTGRVLNGIKAGTTVAFVTFVVFTLAVMGRVNLFLDVMSQRPDWQNLVARFQARIDYESLRTYVNYIYLTGAPFKIMVASVIGALSGLMGGLVGTDNPGSRGRWPRPTSSP